MCADFCVYLGWGIRYTHCLTTVCSSDALVRDFASKREAREIFLYGNLESVKSSGGGGRKRELFARHIDAARRVTRASD